MKTFDRNSSLVGLIGFILLLLGNLFIMQIGILVLFCVAVAWLSVRVTGPHLEAKKRNGQE
jgi:uncharacterized membrane protein